MAWMTGKQRRTVMILGALTGLVLVVIGVRFLIVPSAAAKFFGIAPDAPTPALHYVIALRDLWLGGLAIAFALLREWRALALWLAMAVLVCFSDAVIAWTSSSRVLSVAFHIGSGIFCAVLAWLAWRCRQTAA
jgi:hypothetical protein